MFRSLHLKQWRQFATVELTFHDRLTVLTGANGSGKTTILHLLNRHWGWNSKFVSTPRFNKRGIRRYWAGFWKDSLDAEAPTPPMHPPPSVPPIRPANVTEIGQIEYSDGAVASLSVPAAVQEVFDVFIQPNRRMPGVYVPSHRPPYIFQKIDSIPTNLDAKQQIFQTYLQELMLRFSGSTGPMKVRSPSYRIKTALISLAAFGYGNAAIQPNADAVRTFEGFQEILRIVLPSSLGFQRINVQVPDVLLDTSSGEFSFDAASGGVAAIIDLSWQIYMYSLIAPDGFVVVIDEPEAHLHPALSQRLLPDLLKAFPAAQFVVATHSPFIVTSVPDSNVYVLAYNDDRRVESTLLDMMNKAASANEVLRDVLGVQFTLPLWVNERLQAIATDFANQAPTEQSLNALRERMAAIGMAHLFPEAMSRVLEQQK